MKFLPLLFKNITRKWTRLLLTIGSFAIALFLFGILAVVNNSFNGALNNMAGVDRLMVQNRVSIIQPVPLGNPPSNSDPNQVQPTPTPLPVVVPTVQAPAATPTKP